MKIITIDLNDGVDLIYSGSKDENGELEKTANLKNI